MEAKNSTDSLKIKLSLAAVGEINAEAIAFMLGQRRESDLEGQYTKNQVLAMRWIREHYRTSQSLSTTLAQYLEVRDILDA